LSATTEVTALKELQLNITARPSWLQFLNRIRHNSGAMVGLVLLGFVVFLAVFADILSPYSPIEQRLIDSLQPPSREHWFGTDELGRDLLSRVLHGTRISLRVAILVLGLAGLVGSSLGAVAGYVGGLVDEVVMRVADVFFAFPHFLLAMALVAALGPGLENAMLAVAIAYWPRYARLVRGSVLSVKNSTYIEAARGIGCSDLRIIVRHILPNAISPVLIQATMDAGIAIVTTAALSFIGLGARPPTPEWGAMIASGRDYILTAWWIPTFPGIFISMTVAGFMLLGDGMRDLLDPTLRGKVNF
jgi:peptide/nickel transport system permease protein